MMNSDLSRLQIPDEWLVPQQICKGLTGMEPKNNTIQHLRHDRKMDQQYLQSSQKRSWI